MQRFRIRCMKTAFRILHRSKDVFGFPVRLQIIAAAAGKPCSDFSEIFLVVQFPYNGCAKFIIYAAGHNIFFWKIDILQKFLCACSIRLQPGNFCILFRLRFDVHGNIIKKMIFIKKTKHFRICSVCIQFHKISKSFDLWYKIRQFAIQRRFTAADTDSFENTCFFFSEKASTSSSEVEGSFSGERTRFPFWQKGHRRLQLPENRSSEMLPGNLIELKW